MPARSPMPRSPFRLATLLLPVLVACASGSPGEEPPGTDITMIFVEAEPAPPKLLDQVCLVYTPRLSQEDAARFRDTDVVTVFAHIGRSLQACMAGTAEPGTGPMPEGFFGARLWINEDGVCQAGAVSCYKPENPTIDRKQAFPLGITRPLWYEPALIGHETWHAYAGSFHPT